MDGAGRPTTEHRRKEADMRSSHLEAQGPVREAAAAARAEAQEFAKLPPGEKRDVARRREAALRQEHLERQRKAAPGAPENKALAGPDSNKAEDLSSLTKAELLEKAQAADIEGRSSMTKAQLVKALKKAG